MKIILPVCVLALAVIPSSVKADAQLSKDDVLSMMAHVPMKVCAGRANCAPAGYEHSGDASEVAAAIASAASNRSQAALMVVYAAYESSNIKTAVGDGGRSLGAFQLQGVPRAAAFVPAKAAPLWLTAAQASRAHCDSLPADEQLAELGSGSCSRGRILARVRARVAASL